MLRFLIILASSYFAAGPPLQAYTIVTNSAGMILGKVVFLGWFSKLQIPTYPQLTAGALMSFVVPN
jgi:hypothetical protein